MHGCWPCFLPTPVCLITCMVKELRLSSNGRFHICPVPCLRARTNAMEQCAYISFCLCFELTLYSRRTWISVSNTISHQRWTRLSRQRRSRTLDLAAAQALVSRVLRGARAQRLPLSVAQRWQPRPLVKLTASSPLSYSPLRVVRAKAAR